MLRSLRWAFGLLTVLPLVPRDAPRPGEIGRALAAFPLVGAVVGGGVAGLRALAASLGATPAVAAAVALSAWVLLTGGLHLDGLMDAVDGLLGGRTPAQRLAIMRDERVGAFGALAGMLLLLLKFTALLSAPPPGVVLAAVLGRAVMAVAVAAFPAGRPEGLGAWWKRQATPRYAALAAIGGALPALLSGPRGWLALVAATGALMLGSRFALRRLPGLTGDLYGALCEGAELAALLAWS